MKKLVISLIAICLCMIVAPTIEAKDKKKPTVKLTPVVTEWTRKNVRVNVTAKDKSGIKSIQWQAGKVKKGKKYYWESTRTISNKKYFTPRCNGWYSVKVTDKKGNWKIETIKISNIDKEGPNVRSSYTVKNKVATINVSASDPRGIKNIYWTEGYILEKKKSNFQNKVNGNSFIGKSNGYYTIRATDKLGNVSLHYVRVKLWENIESLSVFDYDSAEFYAEPIYDRWGTMYYNTLAFNDTDDGSAYMEYCLNGKYQYFEGTIVRGKGIYDGAITWFEIYKDDVLIYTSPKMDYKTQPQKFCVDIGKARYLKIRAYTTDETYGSYRNSSSVGMYITGGKLYN